MMVIVLLIVVFVLSIVAVLAYRQAHERASWARYRVRLAHGTDIPRVEAQFLGLCYQAGGGEIWAVKEGQSYAFVVALPKAWSNRFEYMMTRYAPGSHLAPVRELTSPQAPIWSKITLETTTAHWPFGMNASLVMIAITKNGQRAMFAADCGEPPSVIAARSWRKRNLPMPRWLRRYGLAVVRSLLIIPSMTKNQSTGLFPNPTLVPGSALPVLPMHRTQIRARTGGILRLGYAHDGAEPILPLGNRQAIEIVGGSEERRPLLVHSLKAILQADASLIAFLEPETVDVLLSSSDQLRRRMRIVDYRSMATTATLDLSMLLNDDHIVSLLDAIMLFEPLDPVRRLIRPALRHWRNDRAPQQIGLLLARLLDPPPEVSALAQDEDGGESFFNWRTYGARWQMCLQPYIGRKLLGLLTAPGEQVAPLMEAGGALIVVQPPDPKQRRALHLILEAIIKALPPVSRPIMVASEGEQSTDRLAIDPHASLWTSSNWGSIPAWRMVTGGMHGKAIPSTIRELVQHPLALTTLKQHWFLCGPDVQEYAVMLQPGSVYPARLVHQGELIPLPTMRPMVMQTEHNPSRMEERAAAAQTVLASLRRIGAIHGAIGTIEYVIAHEVKRRPVESIEGVMQTEQTVEMALRNVSPAMEEHLPMYLADGATAMIDAQWTMTDTTIRFLTVNVRTMHKPTVPVWTFRLTGIDGSERTFLWDRLSHLLVTGTQAIQCVRAILCDTLSEADADHAALFVLGDIPDSLTAFLHAPQYTKLAESKSVWSTLSLNDQIDALLATHLVPDADTRDQFVILTVPVLLTLKMVQAIMRLLARAHHRPIVVLLIAEEPRAELIPLTKILPVLFSTNDMVTLRIEHDLQHQCRLPATLDDHVLLSYLTSLPQRKYAKIVKAATDPWTFWQVEPTDLAPAIPGEDPIPFMVSEVDRSQSYTASRHPTGNLQQLHQENSLGLFPNHLDYRALHTIVTRALADSRRQITARMVIEALSEYDIDEPCGWAILAHVHDRTGVLLNRQSGRGAYRINPKLKTEADVWAMFNHRVSDVPLSDGRDSQDDEADVINALYLELE